MGRGGGTGMKDGAHREPVGGGGKGGRPVLAARGARRDVRFVGRSARCLGAKRVRHALAASGRHRAGRAAGHQGCEHQLARTHLRGRTGVDGCSHAARRGDLVQRPGEGDARIVGDRSLQVRARGGGHGDRHPAGRRLTVLAVVEGDVARVVEEGQRCRRSRPGAVHAVRYPNLLGGVVLRKPADQQIPLSNRAGECDRDRRDPRPGRECRSLDPGRGGRAGDRRAWKENSEGGEHGKARGGQGRSRRFHRDFNPLPYLQCPAVGRRRPRRGAELRCQSAR